MGATIDQGRRAITTPETLKPRRGRGNKLTARERRTLQDVFLAEFAKSAIIVRGLEKADVNRSTLDWWLEHDAEFSLKYGIAKREADDHLRSIAHRRGVEGEIVTKEIKRRSKNGKMVVDRIETKREVSDSILALVLRSRLPAEFGAATVRVELDQDLIRLIIDVLTRNITDENVLQRIIDDLAQLTTNA